MTEVVMFLTALSLDLALGELPAAVHPVVWMGRLIGVLERFAPRELLRGTKPSPLPSPFGEGRGGKPAPSSRLSGETGSPFEPYRSFAQLAYGAAMVPIGLAIFVLPAWVILGFLREASFTLYFILGTLLLTSTFSVRALLSAAEEVRLALADGSFPRYQFERGKDGWLDGARVRLRSLVSRDTAALDEPLVVAAAVESVAENSSDSFVAPVLYYLVFGVPGALAYRLINTCDSMVGYHGRYEYLGKVPARLDDLANLVPSRLSGALLVLASRFRGEGARRAWKTMWRYHGATESPNAGWPMSAMAGALGVRLVKVGHYTLGDADTPLDAGNIRRACEVALLAMTIMAALVVFVEVLKHARFA